MLWSMRSRKKSDRAENVQDMITDGNTSRLWGQGAGAEDCAVGWRTDCRLSATWGEGADGGLKGSEEEGGGEMKGKYQWCLDGKVFVWADLVVCGSRLRHGESSPLRLSWFIEGRFTEWHQPPPTNTSTLTLVWCFPWLQMTFQQQRNELIKLTRISSSASLTMHSWHVMWWEGVDLFLLKRPNMSPHSWNYEY